MATSSAIETPLGVDRHRAEASSDDRQSQYEYRPQYDRVHFEDIGPDTSADDVGPRPIRDTAWTETTIMKKQNLSKWDVGSLIMNKMVGTGIFTTAGSVLKSTNSKGLSLWLWALGGLYCTLCLVVYLDYGTALPFNGGELIYLNKVWPKPALLSAVMFSGFFICLGHTAGNAVAFSRHVIAAAEPDPKKGESLHIDDRLMKIFAIQILGLVCFLLWVSPKTGLFLNRVLAVYKILLLLVVGFAGIAARNNPKSGRPNSDWKESDTGLRSISGIIYIIYSYTGWENANYIIGDIKTKRRDLRIGAFTAVGLVTFLYFLVNLGYFLACTSEAITNEQSDLAMAEIFAKQVFGGHTIGLKVCIALSAVGNLIAVAYTSSKVKQAIALHHFLPFSNFFAKDDHFLTPGGALLLHFACSSIVIIAMPNTSDGYGFVLGLFTYGQLIVGFMIALGLPQLKGKMGKLEYGKWKPLLSAPWANWVCGLLLALINIVVLVGAAGPHPSNGTARFWWPVILTFILLGGYLYWRGLKSLRTKLPVAPDPSDASDPQAEHAPAASGEKKERSFGDKLGWNAKVEQSENLDDLTRLQREERRDGAEDIYVHTVVKGGRASKIQQDAKKTMEWFEEWVI